jgi:hypothetical protein
MSPANYTAALAANGGASKLRHVALTSGKNFLLTDSDGSPARYSMASTVVGSSLLLKFTMTQAQEGHTALTVTEVEQVETLTFWPSS